MKPMKEAKRLTGRDDDEKYEEEIFIQTSHPAAVVAPFSRDIEPTLPLPANKSLLIHFNEKSPPLPTNLY